MKRVLFTLQEVMGMVKKYQQIHKSDDMSEYSHGVVNGIDVVLFLMESCEE